MGFWKKRDGVVSSEKFLKDAEFYDGDIKVDAILGFDWLRKNQVGVYPHASGLELENGNMVYLVDGNLHSGGKGVSSGGNQNIRQSVRMSGVVETHGKSARRKESDRWVTEGYMVVAHVKKVILEALGNLRPTIDYFAE